MPPKKKSPRRNKNRRTLKSLFNFQNLAFVVVIAIFVISVVWSEPISHLFSGIKLEDTQIISTATTMPGTPMPLPLEYYSTPDQTSGILLGVMILVVIILAGTTGIILRDKSSK